MLSDEFVAGFFDGEGSIGIYPNSCPESRSYYLRTQLTQNVGFYSRDLLEELLLRFGGSLNVMKGARNSAAFNWQLNGDRAVAFLTRIEPHLRLKRDQARIAMAWQGQRPPVLRNARGHIIRTGRTVLAFDDKVYRFMQALKSRDIDEVISAQPGFDAIIAILDQRSAPLI